MCVGDLEAVFLRNGHHDFPTNALREQRDGQLGVAFRSSFAGELEIEAKDMRISPVILDERLPQLGVSRISHSTLRSPRSQ